MDWSERVIWSMHIQKMVLKNENFQFSSSKLHKFKIAVVAVFWTYGQVIFILLYLQYISTTSLFFLFFRSSIASCGYSICAQSLKLYGSTQVIVAHIPRSGDYSKLFGKKKCFSCDIFLRFISRFRGFILPWLIVPFLASVISKKESLAKNCIVFSSAESFTFPAILASSEERWTDILSYWGLQAISDRALNKLMPRSNNVPTLVGVRSINSTMFTESWHYGFQVTMGRWKSIN